MVFADVSADAHIIDNKTFEKEASVYFPIKTIATPCQFGMASSNPDDITETITFTSVIAADA